MSKKLSISDYLLDEGKRYAMYTLQFRAIPYLADGLKAGARRTLWCARDGAKIKSATLAGITVPLHPHAPPEDSIDTLTGPYVNNIPLFDGYGTFGTLINPIAYGASRYTSVKVSAFTKDVLFRDIEVIPMVPNYDSTLMEPKHFLPLSPIAIMNPTDGIAVGFATHILPRTFKDIVESQLEHLAGKVVKERAPHFLPTNNPATRIIDKKGMVRWLFKGDYKIGNNEVKITRLPYGITHSDFIGNLHTLIDKEAILDFEDASRDKINITVKFKRGILTTLSTEDVEKLLKIHVAVSENLNVVNLDGNSVVTMDYVTIIKEFTDWRLNWYVDRYLRLLELLVIDIQHYDDILLAIKKNVSGVSKKIANRTELKQFISDIGVVYIDYIADLPVYRFTEEEARKIQEKREAALAVKASYEDILNDDAKRKAIYVSELKEVLKKYG
jgi:DNA gyrase subunit A